MAEVECLIDERFGIGESPVWDAANNRLLFCDVPAGAIHGIDLESRSRQVWKFPGQVGSFGLARSGRWVVAVDCGVRLFDPSTGRSDLVAQPEPDNPDFRLNDGKVGPDGAFWVGTMANAGREPVGNLYRVTADGRVEKKLDRLTITNGLAWSPDGRTMYHADTRGPLIDAWDFDPATGAMSNRRRFPAVPEASGSPDGAATDAEGGYWSAGLFAARVNRFAADGRLVGHVPIPARLTSMPCFGGPDMKTLFVTSISLYMTPEALAEWPLSGGVFMTRVDVAGAPVARFAD